MNTNRIRTSLLGLAGAVAGFAFQGCTPQPLPECSVTITSAALGLGPYYVQLKKESSTGTGSCGDLTHMQVGLQRFRTAPSGGAFTLAAKTDLVTDPYLGYIYSENVDDSNDCANEDDCQGAGDLANACVNLLADGGVELNDGTVVDPTTGDFTVMYADGGSDMATADLMNECGPVADSIPRVDPADPDGKNLNAIGDMAQFPVNGQCAVTNWKGGAQNYQAEDLSLVDGTSKTLPAITYKVEFENFNVLSTTKVPGTAFTTTVKYTEGGCSATFTGVGFWPQVHCSADVDCDPSSDLDAGRLLGSGINPDFKPTCNKDLGVCVPSVDVTTLK